MLNNVHEQYADLQDKVEELETENTRITMKYNVKRITNEKLKDKIKELETAIANYYRSNCGGYKNVEEHRAVELFVDENT